MIKPRFLVLSDIRRDATSSRAELDDAAVIDYATAYSSGEKLPPVVVYQEGETHWLSQGFHRCAAAERAGLTEIAVEVRKGTQRDALLDSIAAHEEHGEVRLTNADKRRNVGALLADAEWAKWSDREIARRCKVGYTLVAAVRAEQATARAGSCTPNPATPRRTKGKDGKWRAASRPSTKAKPAAPRKRDPEAWQKTRSPDYTDIEDPGCRQQALLLDIVVTVDRVKRLWPEGRPFVDLIGKLRWLAHNVELEEKRR